MRHDAVTVSERMGAEASGFVARQVTQRIVSDADLVVTMTAAHRNTDLELAPNRLKVTFTLTEAASLVSAHNAPNVVDLAALRSGPRAIRLIFRSHRSKRGKV